MSHPYDPIQPSRTDVDHQRGAVVLDFGTNWCGFCQAAAPLVEAALAADRQVQHLKVEDGPGRALGRSFRVKLWPTLVFLRDGVEVARLVRPQDRTLIDEALASVKAPGPASGAA